jgi:hypothetical protein
MNAGNLAMRNSGKLIFAAIASGAFGQTSSPPLNDLPQPYRTVRDWGELPSGMKWAAVTGVEPGQAGIIFVIHRCFANSCAGRSEPPILKYVSLEGPDTFSQPTDVVVSPRGDIFVTDGHRPTKSNRIVKFSKDGKFIKSWGKKGTAQGEFNEPHTIAMDSRGRLFVGDRENNRIQIFDQEGKFLDVWTQFGRPSGIFIAKDDTIYVADSESWGPDQPGWKKGIRIGSARDGTVKAFIEDKESTTSDHSGAEGVGVDSDGNVYGAVVRRQMLEKHIRK